MSKKILIVFLITITLLNSVMPVLKAIEIEKANLINDHTIDTHLMYKPNETWVKIKGAYICYIIDNEKYPVYCISHGKHGVDEEGDYTVTINDLLKDKLIYNTIINGYPYKTPEELGVSNNDEAYIATKQAIYSVILERDVKSFYKAVDSAGEKIIEAIYNISENGKKGNTINQDAKLEIKKINELKEEGEFYYQEYSVISDKTIRDYAISSLEGFSKNVYVADEGGVKKEKFLSGEKFRVMIPKEDLNSDILGKVNIKASCITNPIFFGEAPKNTVQNYAVTYKPFVTYNSSIIVDVKANTGKVKLMKKDKESLLPIEGVNFGLYNKNEELIEKNKTNNNGEITFSNLYQGKYYIKELETTEHYILDERLHEINVEFNKTTEYEVLNNHKKGNFKLIKVDKDKNNITLGGIEFELINSKGEIERRLVTDADGECYVENINTGEYILRETKTKKEYRIAEEENITIKWNETLEKVVENEKKKGKLEIYKVDKEDNSIKLKDVEFALLDKEDNIVQKLKTNEKGYVISKSLEVGRYYLKEVKTNSKYILNDKKIPIDIEDNEVLKLKLENQKIKGNIKILKTSSENSEILNIRKGEIISDVKFEIYDSNKNLVETLITDNEGIAISKDLEIGRYIIKEAERKRGFLINSKEYFATIKENNQVEIVNVENTPISPRVNIDKIGVEYAEKNEEIKYEFDISNISNTNLDELTWIDYLPYEQTKVTKIMTGVYNEEINYKIYYKTDKKDYQLLKEANSICNEYINLDDIGLAKDENIIELKIEYGNVSESFKTINNPYIYVKTNNSIKKGSKFINKTELIGIKDGYEVKDDSLFETIIKEKEIIKKLPKTGC